MEQVCSYVTVYVVNIGIFRTTRLALMILILLRIKNKEFQQFMYS